MATLFLASEAQEEGRAGIAADWARIAGLVHRVDGPADARSTVVFQPVAGHA